MPALGLTGNIASGKSHIAEIFRSLGAVISNADIIAHEVMNNEAFAEIATLFPETVEDGKINRRQLGRIVFNDEAKLAKLEYILHPLVRRKNLEFITANKSRLTVLEIPLLFETNAESICDHTLFINVSRETQITRALTRPGMDLQKLEKILARQTRIPVAEKIARADFVINNEPGNDIKAEVETIIHSICG